MAMTKRYGWSMATTNVSRGGARVQKAHGLGTYRSTFPVYPAPLHLNPFSSISPTSQCSDSDSTLCHVAFEVILEGFMPWLSRQTACFWPAEVCTHLLKISSDGVNSRLHMVSGEEGVRLWNLTTNTALVGLPESRPDLRGPVSALNWAHRQDDPVGTLLHGTGSTLR